MPSYKVTSETDLRKDAAATAPSLTPAGLLEGTILTFAGEKRDEGAKKDAWIKVSFTPEGSPASVVGWVDAATVEEVPDPPRPELDPVGFVRECYATERRFNASERVSHWVISGELIIARAVFETGMKNLGSTAGSPAGLGPLQVTPGEWDAYTKDAGALVLDARPESRGHPTFQISAAAWRMHTDIKAISDAKLAKGVGTADTPFMPTYLDVFHASLLDDAKAAVAVSDAQVADGGRDRLIKDILGWEPAKLDELLNRRRAQLGDDPKLADGTTLKLGDFIAATDKALALALKAVFEFTRDNTPDELPAVPASPDVAVVAVDIAGLALFPAEPAFAATAIPRNQMFWPVITDIREAMVVSYRDAAGSIIGGHARHFFADRRNGARHHVGLDVYCRDGEDVVACADGTVVSYYPFYRTSTGEQSFALFVDHGDVVVNYGEVKAGAPVQVGQSVRAGQKIGVVSSTDMIHFEAYVPGTKVNSRWLRGEVRPMSLLNPTRLLLELAAGATRILKNGQHQAGGGSARVVKAGMPLAVTDDDLLTLARTIYGEARGEPPAGRAAVAHVVMNRLDRRFRGDDTVAKVCRHRAQFSCWNDKDKNLKVIRGIQPGATRLFDACCDVAEQVMKGQAADNTGGATHYYSEEIPRPDWARSPARQTVQIGHHLFFNNVA
jgi:murein DD-endopeptidase MepM/ murein hydrolase activator NlpD